MEEGEDRLTNKPLKYMETSYNKVIQEFNYDKLQLVQKEVLEHELKEKEGIIDYMSNNRCNGLRRNHTEVKELYCIINTNSITSSMLQDNNLNHILSQIMYVVDRLNGRTLQSKDILQKTNKYYWGFDDDMEDISALPNDNHQTWPP